ncbi:MAG: hypothetical protein A3K18_09815, partial [Lentisphaerae bacterium RIFOXYA12_64_32]
TVSVYLPICDQAGNVVQLLDADSATIVAEYTYSPFGELLCTSTPGVSSRGRSAAGSRFAPRSEPRAPSSPCPFLFATRYFDTETGLYYYGYRYYNPRTGKWLTRDPLGEAATRNLLAYCNNDPVNLIDLLGLAGYFFDGTGNDRDRFGAHTNVSILEMLYRGNTVYARGVGTGNAIDRGPGGGLSGYGGWLRLEDMYRDLVLIYNSGDTVIDIFGFSRGAALARTFANLIAERGIPLEGQFEDCWDASGRVYTRQKRVYPKIRVLGIFDTVASFGIPGNNWNIGYNLSIPDCVGFTAHARAEHEFRGTFPFSSIYALDEAIDLSRKIEKTFPGAHADDGAGYRDHPEASYAPLKWMWEMGNRTANGAMFRPLPGRVEKFLNSNAGKKGVAFLHDSRVDETTGKAQWKYIMDWWHNVGDRKIYWMER